MSLNAATIEYLLGKGLTGQDLLEVARLSERKADPTNAERQARHRAKKARNAVTVTRDPSPNEYISNPQPVKSEPNGSDKKIEIPDWMPAGPWAEFRAMRKSMRNVPFGPGAERRVIAKIEKARAEGHDPEKLLSKAIESSHRTVFPDDTTKATAGKPIQQSREEQITALKRMLEIYSQHGRFDDVRETRRRIAELEGGKPPGQVSSLVSQTVSGMRVRAA